MIKYFINMFIAPAILIADVSIYEIERFIETKINRGFESAYYAEGERERYYQCGKVDAYFELREFIRTYDDFYYIDET